jgi:hypothetical protein
MIAPELRVIAPAIAVADPMVEPVYELVAFRVAAFETVTALEARIEPVEPRFKIPLETLVAPV